MLYHLYDMIANRREDWLGHLAILQCEGGIFKFFQSLTSTYLTYRATALCRTRVFTVFSCHLSEVCASKKGVIDGVSTLLYLALSLRISLLCQAQKDVSRLHQSVRTYSILRRLIDFSCLSLNISIVNKGRTNLLITIFQILLIERSKSIKMLFEGGSHLQFVVDKQFHIFLHGLSVDDTVGIVLVIGIFKFGTQYRFSSYSHDNRVIDLRTYSQRA